MSKRVLVPLDGSEQSDRAVEFAFEEFPHATVTLFHVINPTRAGYGAQAGIPSFSEEWYEEAEERASELFDEARERAPDTATVETAIEVGQPSRAVIEYVEGHDVDQVVMGSHGREGITRVLLGSVAETVVRRSPVPVTVVR